MVLQQKVRSATKNISKKAVQSRKPSMSELDTSDEDNEDLAMKMDEIEDDDDEEDEVEDSEEEEDEVEDEEDNDEEEVSKQNFTIGCNQNLQQVKNKTPVEKEASSIVATYFSLAKQNENYLAKLQQNKIRLDLRDARRLKLRYLPVDVTQEEVKSLSDDIINVMLLHPEAIKGKSFENVFVLVEFASVEKAEENYAALQNHKLRGMPITLEYVGVKSEKLKKLKKKDLFNRLSVRNLPINIKITQIAKLTPNATSIIITVSKMDRMAILTFESEEEAAEAFEANKETRINGKLVTFLYYVKN